MIKFVTNLFVSISKWYHKFREACYGFQSDLFRKKSALIKSTSILNGAICRTLKFIILIRKLYMCHKNFSYYIKEFMNIKNYRNMEDKIKTHFLIAWESRFLKKFIAYDSSTWLRMKQLISLWTWLMSSIFSPQWVALWID